MYNYEKIATYKDYLKRKIIFMKKKLIKGLSVFLIKDNFSFDIEN
ncbi:hypothetical protein [Clostridium saccharobutylicum]|uniref:Uncharacterized protein n=1 Tax=Clostridium saccharobutylicum DSM 13864 TaxID=1345695 RepID=U5MMN9_CLOSA|nr:hypothetical protein [Clostridium saccharobutylicum]AGX41793.1 hypothetical protein CLSA_c07800 [Clostridium saccharobutylicum DSM 13864]MBA8895192.1 hypothetical protein [Clostridium saccharobutylicum]MBA8982083.1 hypothetical protein [Clostridium saccharobutylicum]MBA9000342.1 hypothetical protein [Clostridium saccharobutylicum]MBA9011814.1 hypothetical protein [Clostridium saccharobutylicum]